MSSHLLFIWEGPADSELDSEILTPQTDEMLVFPCLTEPAGVALLTSLGSDWYLSTDNSNLSGGAKSERDSRKPNG